MTDEALRKLRGSRRKGVKISLWLPIEAGEQLRRLQSVYNLGQTGVISQAIGKLYQMEPLAWPKQEKA